MASTLSLAPAQTLAGTYVVKLGGRPLESEGARVQLARDLVRLRERGARLVLVHGGGSQVTRALEASGLEARFVNGLRVTDARTLEVAEPVFTHLGKQLAHALSCEGAPALALTGRDALLVQAVVKDAALGRVGTVTAVDAELLRHLAFNGLVPVVGPIAVDAEGPLNVNADEVASAVAAALGARELLLLTDVPAVRGAAGEALARLTRAEADALVESGVASGGMVPKVRGALDALARGVGGVRVLDAAGLAALAEGGEAGTLFVEG